MTEWSRRRTVTMNMPRLAELERLERAERRARHKAMSGFLMDECAMRVRRGFKDRVIIDHDATRYPWARFVEGARVEATFSLN